MIYHTRPSLLRAIIYTTIVVSILFILAVFSRVEAYEVGRGQSAHLPLHPFEQFSYEEIQEEIRRAEEEAKNPILYTEQDVIDIAKVLFHECNAVESVTEQACVAWVILNRTDGNPEKIAEIVRMPNQFAFFEDAPVYKTLIWLAEDVLSRWNKELNGFEDVGRVLPPDYKYFYGDGEHNYFRNNYSAPYDTWDYSLKSPYQS